MKPVVGYWDLRGRANAIRLLLHYAGVDFTDKRYSIEQAEEWFGKDKNGIGLDFPNIPYYIDSNVKMSQSKAILHFLGRKHGLDGKTEKEQARMGVIYEQVTELVTAIEQIAYPPQIHNREEIHELKKNEFITTLPTKLEAIVKFIGSDDYMCGNRVTYVDFWIYDVFDFVRRLFNPKHFNAFPTLVAYMKRIEGLKGVKEFLNSDSFKPMPIFGPYALIGNTQDYKPTD